MTKEKTTVPDLAALKRAEAEASAVYENACLEVFRSVPGAKTFGEAWSVLNAKGDPLVRVVNKLFDERALAKERLEEAIDVEDQD